jgi:hypothetical protein
LSGAHTQAQRWVEGVALPVVRSERPDVEQACNFIGLHAIGTMMALCGGRADVRACVEAATLSLLEDVAASATRGAEESARVLAARVKWIASILAASDDASSAVPVPVVERFLSIVRHHAQPATRAAAILSICPALVGILNQDSALCMQVWRLIVALGGLEPIDHLRDAFAMLCVLYDCFRPLLSPKEHEELWGLLHRGE